MFNAKSKKTEEAGQQPKRAILRKVAQVVGIAFGVFTVAASVEISGLLWNLGLSEKANATQIQVFATIQYYQKCSAKAQAKSGFDPSKFDEKQEKRRADYSKERLACLASYDAGLIDADELLAEKEKMSGSFAMNRISGWIGTSGKEVVKKAIETNPFDSTALGNLLYLSLLGELSWQAEEAQDADWAKSIAQDNDKRLAIAMSAVDKEYSRSRSVEALAPMSMHPALWNVQIKEGWPDVGPMSQLSLGIKSKLLEAHWRVSNPKLTHQEQALRLSGKENEAEGIQKQRLEWASAQMKR